MEAEATQTIPEEFKEQFPARLRIARKLRNLKQEDLAAALQLQGVKATKGAVSKWEKAVTLPHMGTFLAICEVLNQPPAFFFDNAYAERPGPTPEEQIAETVIERLMKLLGVSLEGLDPGHDDGEATPDGAPMESKDQVLLDRFAEVLARKLAAQLTKTLVPALQQTIEETLKKMPNAQKR